METVRHIFDRITSIEYQAEIGISSGYKTCIRIIENEPWYEELGEIVKTETGMNLVLVGLKELRDREINKKYANPYDDAYCFIVWAVANHRPEKLYTVMKELFYVRNCHWLHFIALEGLRVVCEKVADG